MIITLLCLEITIFNKCYDKIKKFILLKNFNCIIPLIILNTILIFLKKSN
jgi:hypothetical protein